MRILDEIMADNPDANPLYGDDVIIVCLGELCCPVWEEDHQDQLTCPFCIRLVANDPMTSKEYDDRFKRPN